MNQLLGRSLLSMHRIPTLDPEHPPLEEITIETPLLDLVRLRVAFLNECPLCINYHSYALRQNGESDSRISQVRAWTESVLFEESERAALALADSLVAEPGGPISEDIVQLARNHFNDAEILQLVLAILAANDWNYQAQQYPNEAITAGGESGRYPAASNGRYGSSFITRPFESHRDVA